jgi:hypothetical protein
MHFALLALSQPCLGTAMPWSAEGLYYMSAPRTVLSNLPLLTMNE